MKGKLTALIILDGYGRSSKRKMNAVYQAKTPFLDRFKRNYPHTLIDASGMAVGLPEGQMGNSEVGHMNLGAGRIVYQELTRITKSINDWSFYQNKAFLKGVENCKKHDSALHLMGLLSDGGVHSHYEHLFALLDLAKTYDLEKVYVHVFTDGRDTSPKSAGEYLIALQNKISSLGIGKIATVSGRYYAMDRDNHWDRIEKAYRAIVGGEGEKARTAGDCIHSAYDNEISDEFIYPCVIDPDEDKTLKENDTIIFFNFRPDRARQLTRTFIEEKFKGFERPKGYFPVCMITMTQYDASFQNLHVAFKPQVLKNTLGEYLSAYNKKQLRIAETEKYAHVTYFFNGGVETQYPGEMRLMVSSPMVATYDLKPEMSAYELTNKVLHMIDREKFDAIILNYANCDMVGHTGNYEAALEAVQTVDACAEAVVHAVLKRDGNVILTADHGNAEKMIDADGNPWTAHTTNPVNVFIAGIGKKVKLSDGGKLADIAPTMLELMGLPKPDEMTGESLIIREAPKHNDLVIVPEMTQGINEMIRIAKKLSEK